MCRSIKTLRRPDTAATTGELEAAARQYVRKISGYRTPAARNADAFDAAIAEVAAASQRLLDAIGVDIEEGPDRWTRGPRATSMRRRRLAAHHPAPRDRHGREDREEPQERPERVVADDTTPGHR